MGIDFSRKGPYHHWRLSTRPGSGLRRRVTVGCVEKHGGRHDLCFGRIRGRNGGVEGGTRGRIEDVGGDGAEESIEGELGEASLGTGS